jgi:hypothetical protein
LSIETRTAEPLWVAIRVPAVKRGSSTGDGISLSRDSKRCGRRCQFVQPDDGVRGLARPNALAYIPITYMGGQGDPCLRVRNHRGAERPPLRDEELTRSALDNGKRR